jgi:hypothetical protein
LNIGGKNILLGSTVWQKSHKGSLISPSEIFKHM